MVGSVGFMFFCFVLRTTSVSPLDRDKDTLSLTRKNADAFFRLRGVEIWWALSGSWGEEAVYLNSKMQLFFEFTEEVDMVKWIWWALPGSNQRPGDYESPALTD